MADGRSDVVVPLRSKHEPEMILSVLRCTDGSGEDCGGEEGEEGIGTLAGVCACVCA